MWTFKIAVLCEIITLPTHRTSLAALFLFAGILTNTLWEEACFVATLCLETSCFFFVFCSPCLSQSTFFYLLKQMRLNRWSWWRMQMCFSFRSHVSLTYVSEQKVGVLDGFLACCSWHLNKVLTHVTLIMILRRLPHACAFLMLRWQLFFFHAHVNTVTCSVGVLKGVSHTWCFLTTGGKREAGLHLQGNNSSLHHWWFSCWLSLKLYYNLT